MHCCISDRANAEFQGETQLHLKEFSPYRRNPMQMLMTATLVLIALDVVVFVALYFRRSRPEWRARLFNWVVNGDAKLRSQARLLRFHR